MRFDIRFIGLVIAGTSVIACCDTRVGLERSPVGAVYSDQASIRAIRRALPPEQQTCQVELPNKGKDADSEDTLKQVVTVEVCGKPQKFSIQRSAINADSVLIAAKKL